MNQIIECITNVYKNLEPKEVEAYNIGPLLYTPATDTNLFDKLKEQSWGNHYSLALCLEDAIDDSAVDQGEKNIIENMRKLYENIEQLDFIPQIFIRVRYPHQITKLFKGLGRSAVLLRGFIIPKFSAYNGQSFIDEIMYINDASAHTIYFLPILEGSDLISHTTRFAALQATYEMLMKHKEYVINVRVGGNDLCNIFGVRRNVNETIYDIRSVSTILNDIVSVFFQDFVISGPVWEYFSGENESWKKGLLQEMRLDSLNGFTGKTVIHPNQIPVVLEGMKISQQDLVDAVQILTFESDLLQVSKSASGTRMNEMKTHINWAKKQIILANLYGVN